jgi:hypothetical protein
MEIPSGGGTRTLKVLWKMLLDPVEIVPAGFRWLFAQYILISAIAPGLCVGPGQTAYKIR